MVKPLGILPNTRRTASVSPKYVPSPNSWYGDSLEGRLSGLLELELQTGTQCRAFLVAAARARSSLQCVVLGWLSHV